MSKNIKAGTAGQAAALPADHMNTAETSTDENEFTALAQAYFRRHGAAAAHALLADIQRIADQPGAECRA